MGAVLAALGYVGKEIVQLMTAWRTDKAHRRARLHQLQTLLQASRAAFVVQRAQADRLAERLPLAHRSEPVEGAGLERLFSRFYSRHDEDERTCTA